MPASILGIVALLSVILGILVFLQAPRNQVNRAFAVMTYAMAAWATTNAVFLLSNGDFQFMTALVSYGAAAWLTVSFVHFCNAIVIRKLDKQTLRMIDIVTVLIGCASVMPGFIAIGVENGEIQTQSIPLAVYGIAIALGLVIGNTLLIYAARTAPKKQRLQYVVLLLGLALGTVIGLFCNLLLPMMGNYGFVALGPAGLLIFIVAAVYAITKHNLFDVRLATVRAVGYTATIASLSFVYFAIAFVLSELAISKELNPATFGLVHAGLTLFLAVLFQPVRQFFGRLTDKVFFHSQYNTDEFMSELGEALTSTVHLREMLTKASSVIENSLHASSLSFVVYRDNRKDIIVTAGKKAAFDRDDTDGIRAILEIAEDEIIDLQHELVDDPAVKVLEKLRNKHYSLLLPLGEQLGFVLIRERLSGSYSERDMRVLAAISDQLTIAIQNARSVEGLHELNATLQQRIDKATRQLRNTNSKLRKLDETKDEFVSMASHQLRTPLTSVKGYVSMLLEGDAGKLTKQQEKLLQEAFVSSERMVRLIGDFLNVSRLQTGKFMIDTHIVDMVQLVEEEVASIRGIAESHGQDLDYRGPTGEIMVAIDADKTRQVIMNFIDNAIYYSPSTSLITVKLHAAKNKVVFEVHDKGIGVPKEQQAQLFTKFFRADNARKQRPDGTGVGLFLAKKVIEAQGGEIIFHSREGMGSVFGFSLPIKK